MDEFSTRMIGMASSNSPDTLGGAGGGDIISNCCALSSPSKACVVFGLRSARLRYRFQQKRDAAGCAPCILENHGVGFSPSEGVYEDPDLFFSFFSPEMENTTKPRF